MRDVTKRWPLDTENRMRIVSRDFLSRCTRRFFPQRRGLYDVVTLISISARISLAESGARLECVLQMYTTALAWKLQPKRS